MEHKRYLLGVDVGTSSAKALIIDAAGCTVSSASSAYDISTPLPGYAEQDANMLRDAAFHAIKEAVAKAGGGSNIAAVGFTGQMHGLVALDERYCPLRPVIIWADQRSTAQAQALKSHGIEEITMNPASTGFFFPSLLWVKEHEPEIYCRIRSVVFPKDYVRFSLTGRIGTDLSDASGSLLLNPRTLHWDAEILALTGVKSEILPEIHESSEIAGYVTEAASLATGLNPGTTVVYGGGDTPMLLAGNGIVSEGELTTNIGTASQINCICRQAPEGWRHLNVFHHASKDLWFSAGASLNGGLVLKWARDVLMGGSISFSDMDRYAEASVPGANGVVLLPFLCGERAPYLDPNAKAILFGLKLSNTKADIVRSIMESVIYSFRDCMEVFSTLGLNMDNSITASGGGAKSPVWLQMQADILKKRIIVKCEAVEAARGAAIAAGVGIGIYASYDEASQKMPISIKAVYEPNPENFAIYDRRFETYQNIYRRNKGLF